jgi:cytochrome c oxidase subunit 1
VPAPRRPSDFAYAPLTARAFTPGNATDYWNLAILVAGVGTIATAINMVTTILTMRGPGMKLGRMPIFVWEILTISALTLIILPPLSAAQIMLLLDRFLGAHFFDTQAGASAVMWQHFFWFFGYPEVYILILPGFGLPEIIPVFRKVIFGYVTLVAASVGSALIAMGTWAHHMFVVGMEARSTPRLPPDDAGRSPHRDQDLQLARHDVRREDPLATPMPSLRVPSSSCARA